MRAYDYWWGYTAAQVELMVADVPFVSYKDKKEKKATKNSMDSLADAWAAKHRKEGSPEKIKLSDYFKKDFNSINK